MRVNLEDIGISLDFGDWVHKYVEEIQSYAARRKAEEPFPNLKIDVNDTPLEDIHSAAEELIKHIKNGLPPVAKLSNLQKFQIGQFKGISTEIRGRQHEGKEILIIMYIISTVSKLVSLSFTLVEDTFSEHADEFKQIVNSFMEL